MHKVCHCDAVAAVRGGTGRKKMNETKAIFSFCFSQDEFVKKIPDRLKRTIERAE